MWKHSSKEKPETNVTIVWQKSLFSFPTIGYLSDYGCLVAFDSEQRYDVENYYWFYIPDVTEQL